MREGFLTASLKTNFQTALKKIFQTTPSNCFIALLSAYHTTGKWFQWSTQVRESELGFLFAAMVFGFIKEFNTIQ